MQTKQGALSAKCPTETTQQNYSHICLIAHEDFAPDCEKCVCSTFRWTGLIPSFTQTTANHSAIDYTPSTGIDSALYWIEKECGPLRQFETDAFLQKKDREN